MLTCSGGTDRELGMHTVRKNDVNNVYCFVGSDFVEPFIVVDVVGGDTVLVCPLFFFCRRAGYDSSQPAMLRRLQGWSDLVGAKAAEPD